MRRALPLLLALCAVLAGCVGRDPFGLSRRPIGGNFELEGSEGFAAFTLQRAGDESPAGYTGAAVERIGWNRRYILVRHLSSPDSPSDDWRIVDMETGHMSALLTSGQVERRPEARGITPRPAREAWTSLPQKPISTIFLSVAGIFGVAAVAYLVAALRKARRVGHERQPA